jgi:hypothetical protein
MTDPSLTERQVRLLRIVAEGGGKRDARQIDLTISSRYGPGQTTVLGELEELKLLGLVTTEKSRGGVGGRWAVTQKAQPYLTSP